MSTSVLTDTVFGQGLEQLRKVPTNELLVSVWLKIFALCHRFYVFGAVRRENIISKS